MLIGTQIRSFLVPFEIWYQGYDGRRDLPPLAIPARDALDIERRSGKDLSLRNEAQRYTLCCERIQEIVAELTIELEFPALLFPSDDAAKDSAAPNAGAYLALMNTLRKSLKGSPYRRVSAVFFPPEHAILHSQVYEVIGGRDGVDELFIQASKRGSLPNEVCNPTAEQCRAAFAQRHRLLKIAASEGKAIVDLIELT